MFRPPFLARVAAGAAVYALEETRRLPTAAMNFPITAISQLLQTTMHVQQFVTSLALKGDAVFDRLGSGPEGQPDWATFDEDLPSEQTSGSAPATAGRTSRFDLYTEGEPAEPARATNGHVTAVTTITVPEITRPEPESEPESEPVAEAEPEPAEIAEPEIATRYDYANMTLAQLRARLRMLTLEDLATLLDYEQQTRARAAFVTMLTNRIATVQAQ
ncbi:lipid droplet-associated protein [Nocardia sp. XZ_19_385]|uniref:lipid droplet-associated protein n=1 Tax=Nocardia sp. XZ_19_385 TaxID=2769488 RepID=UPI00188F1EDF|nr:lipid droplet-associated protein [Nocardia sp. XZ_19_385]